MHHDSSTPALMPGLLDQAAYPHPTATLTVKETHISWVILTGDFAYKIKKPVKFAFLDFSTLERRHFCCLEELRLNRRLAAGIYLQCVPITGSPGEPRVGGDGTPIEYAIKMRQFADGQLFCDLAGQRRLTAEHIGHLAQAVAGFHQSIAVADADSAYGGLDSIGHWFEENFTCIGAVLADPARLRQLQAIADWGGQERLQKAELFERRKRQGFVRECHGDLHFGNITLVDGQPVMFDCIEFNPQLRWIDTISEIAFLLLDLFRYGHDEQAHACLNRYLQLTGDYGGLWVLRFYLVYRALVRAKLLLLRAVQQTGAGRVAADGDCAACLDWASRFCRPPPPLLLLTHGFSGAGKSVLAAALAARVGGIQLRSDIERKRLFGYGEQESSDGRIYSLAANRQTYQRLWQLAQTVVGAGFTAIVDAAFLKADERAQFRQLAADCGVRFGIVSVTAPVAVLRDRIGSRVGDASEATVQVLERQLLAAEPLSAAELAEALLVDNGQRPPARALARIEAWLEGMR